MYPEKLSRSFIIDNNLVSCLLRDRLETKLTELYANGYEAFLDEQIPASNDEQSCFDELLKLTAVQENTNFYEYRQAWIAWSTMNLEDRLYLLKTFQQHFSSLNACNKPKRNVMFFCKVFITEFVPLIATTPN
ncbi:hypothetical protein [Mucilaginibacter flavus]|uniref:hypothetical protein n=1 Tax=Mucilaginibacter flavus TaxID=931504 RepID=UPI0025B52830|nr:hypothetical protein [Mucilaginibacter flavus]